MGKLILVVLLLSGCSGMSLNPPPEYYEAQIARIAAAQALAEKPMVTIECEAGCSVSVLNPNGSVGSVSEGTTTGKVALAAVGSIKSLGKSLALVRVADKVMSAAGDRTVTVNGNKNTLDLYNTDIATTNSKAGDTTGDTSGNVAGNTSGDTSGDIRGDVSGDVRGDVAGDVRGDVSGDIAGDTSGDIRGDEINDSYNPTTTTTTTTTTSTETSEKNGNNEPPL